jgi:hypothetical protein
MSDDIARLLYDGALAVQQGRTAEGRQLLMRVLELDEQNELAWLWLSGAMDDPADQQVALENVLALNPRNAAAQEGLAWLAQHATPSPTPPPPAELPTDASWTPPTTPFDENDVVEMSCWQCHSTLYSVAPFCWQCHAPVRCCNNCLYIRVAQCKEAQGLTNALAQAARNDCPWWHPRPE